MKLLRCETPYFVAGAVYEQDICRKAAPIIKYFVRKNLKFALNYIKKKNWRYQIL